jgi:toxin-antitoxin system PIN domain toxin
VIVPDVNLLVYAHNALAPHHARAKAWWQHLLRSEQKVGLAWVVALGFVRLVTHPSVLVRPLTPQQALEHVHAWTEIPSVRLVDPGPRHLELTRELFRATGVAAGLTTDTHLAALAIERSAELCSNDADFGRFPGLRWSNPLR